MAAERGDIKRSTSNRALVLYTVFLLVAFGIIGRILYIQYGPDGDELREEAMDKTFARRSILANRGDILSYDDRILATTIPEYDIRMDFNSIKLEPQAFAVQADSLAHCLASFFGDRTADSYYNLLMRCYKDKSRNRYVKILPRKIDYMEQEQVSRFPIFRLGRYSGGYIAEQKSKRFRPAGQLARKVIGGIEQDTIARDGIELSYDKYLRGTSGNRLMQKISGSFWLPVQDPANKEPIDGLDVVSTIDIDIQDIAETALKRQLELGGAKWGTVILMETATGKIRALCNLSRPKAGVYLEDYNYAARRRNEPGSTFKLATLLVLLEYGGMNIRTPVDCNSDGMRKRRIGSAVITDDHRIYGSIPLKEVFEQSSNIGFANAVYKRYMENPERYMNFLRDSLHLGAPTGIDLEGEVGAEITAPKYHRLWDGKLQRMAYGYAVSVTPLQTLTLYNAVANNGRMMKPMLVSEIRSYGETLETFAPQAIDSALCSPATIRAARECMEGVVEEKTGTGHKVMLGAPYKAAVKTGTAQVARGNRGYGVAGSRDYLASFVGYFPADNPKYSCIVVIETSQHADRSYYGAGLAGPVFRAVADRVYASSIDLHKAPHHDAAATVTDNEVKGGLSNQVDAAAEKWGLSDPAAGGMWWAPHIDSETVMAHNAPDSLANDITMGDDDIISATVPSVVGMGLKDAIYRIESEGLRVKASGEGRVVWQSFAPGTRLSRGNVVSLKLKI